jgi:hypothetical protein
MIKKILKWTGIILLIIIAGVAITTASRQHLKYDASYPDVHASKDTAIIAKGKHFCAGFGALYRLPQHRQYGFINKIR